MFKHTDAAQLAYVKNGLVKAEIETQGNHMGIVGYIPFISFYCKASEHFSPLQSLKLWRECIVVNDLKNVNDQLIITYIGCDLCKIN